MWVRLLRWVPAVIWMGVIFYGSSLSVLPVIDSRPNSGDLHRLGHVVEYSILAVLLLIGAGLRWRGIALTLVIVVLYAASDELHQTFTPGRQGRLQDALFDIVVAAATLALLVVRSMR